MIVGLYGVACCLVGMGFGVWITWRVITRNYTIHKKGPSQ